MTNTSDCIFHSATMPTVTPMHASRLSVVLVVSLWFNQRLFLGVLASLAVQFFRA
ncbi:hypothetical protein PLANPX_6022 [Lacipirellula parvula]|uniref:Uncharacterized protein n=1 Tax=Lacipirellula parvula TaxID=2650471 RepID=A0A5K7XHQ3_9BACT|nr:hypothetical protein PLANPX_6022 [Lacipirellula parvula]